jgi:predicted ATPase
MGLHTGEGILGGDNYLGLDVHRAARIAAAGHGGQVLISAATRGLVSNALPQGVALRDLGRHRLKDIALPEHLYDLVIEGLPADFPPPRTQRARPATLPVQLTSLVGREEEIAEVTRLLDRTRLLTLSGPGGVGKTRLALAVGEPLGVRLDAGVVFVPLVGVTRSEQVLAGIARAVGADVGGTDAPLEALAERLGDDRWLLVLDNLEQVLEVAGDLEELLARCRGVTVLATSRTVLGLGGEQEYPVLPLLLPADPATMTVAQLAASPAVALFVDRARAVHPGFALTESNAAAVVELCRRLEGLPLAIELAAARTRLLDPEELLGRLGRSLDALGTGAVDLPERQHTLRATVEWSVGLLGGTERSLLETVAIFVDGWTIEAAADVANLDEDRALDLTEALARHSLIFLDITELGPRPRMLETIRVCSSPSGWPPDPTPPRSGAAMPTTTGPWPSGPTGRCGPSVSSGGAPARASGSSVCRPRRATWPPPCAGTWPTTPGRCRICSASCGPSGRSGITWARPAPGSTSCYPAPTPSTPRRTSSCYGP